MLSVMITIEVDFDNPISQDFYNKIIFSLNLNQIHCTCGLAGSLIWYGGYYRKVRMADRVIFLRVARVLCTVNITVRRSRQSGVARATCPD